MTTPVVPVTLWDCACLSVVLVSVFTAVRVGVRIRLHGLRLCSRSPWFWCSCVCARICRYGLVCAFTLRGPGARVFVCRYADMGYNCAFALRGSGARVSVCGYADMGKDCALALLGLVLVFSPVVAQRQLPWFAYSADHRDCPVADHWRWLPELFPYFALSGSTVDTCWLQF